MRRSSDSAPGGTEKAERAPLRGSPLFWVGVVVGWSLIVVGVFGAIGNARHTKPVEWGAWILGAAVVHDAVVAPAVIAAGIFLRRRVPKPTRTALTFGLVVSALVVLATLPIFTGLGARPDNPSHLPRDYGNGLALVLAAIWIVTGAVLWRARRRARSGDVVSASHEQPRYP